MYKYMAGDHLNPTENISVYKTCMLKGEQFAHTHDFVEIVYILSGSGRHFVDDVCYDVTRGDLLFINYRRTHSFDTLDEMIYVNCLLKPEFLSAELINSENAFDLLTLSFFEEFGRNMNVQIARINFSGSGLIEIEGVIGQMLKEFVEKKIGYRSVLKGYTTVLLGKIFREMSLQDSAGILQHVKKLTPEIIKYIEDHYERITLSELAGKCFYHPSYFSRIFKEYYGKSLTVFINEKRVKEALRLLQETTMNVDEICHAVGYSNKRHFYKIFKEQTGMTPSKARETIQK